MPDVDAIIADLAHASGAELARVRVAIDEYLRRAGAPGEIPSDDLEERLYGALYKELTDRGVAAPVLMGLGRVGLRAPLKAATRAIHDDILPRVGRPLTRTELSALCRILVTSAADSRERYGDPVTTRTCLMALQHPDLVLNAAFPRYIQAGLLEAIVTGDVDARN